MVAPGPKFFLYFRFETEDGSAIKKLPFGHHLAIATQRHAPEERFVGQAAQSDFAGAVGSLHARPHNAELGFLVVQLYLQNLPGLDLASHALNHHAAAAQVLDAGQLHERQVVSIHAPDSYRQLCLDPRIATTIHSMLLGSEAERFDA